VKPLFHVCGDASFVRLQPVWEVGVGAFFQRIGITATAVSLIKLAQRFTCGDTVFESGAPLSEVSHTYTA
jgi:hypothetical protein